MPISGDDALLDQALATIAQLRSPRTRTGLALALGAAALGEVRHSFRQGVDPWNRPWPPSIRVQKFGGRTLVDTGKLMGSFVADAHPKGFVIRTGQNLGVPSVKYAYVHQYGATIRAKRAPYLVFRPGGRRDKEWAMKKVVRIPARPMLPEGRFPPRYLRAMDQAAITFLATLAGA